MWRFIKHIVTSEIQTETFQKQEQQLEQVGELLSRHIAKRLGRSLAIRLVDAGSCNACELEIQATTNPYYHLERFGIHFVPSPRHADMLLVTGPITKNMKAALEKTFEATPAPKLVVAIGDCASCGGIFKDSYAVAGPLNDIIPVNYVVKGCPPTPVDIISGILAALDIIES